MVAFVCVNVYQTADGLNVYFLDETGSDSTIERFYAYESKSLTKKGYADPSLLNGAVLATKSVEKAREHRQQNSR